MKMYHQILIIGNLVHHHTGTVPGKWNNYTSTDLPSGWTVESLLDIVGRVPDTAVVRTPISGGIYLYWSENLATK